MERTESEDIDHSVLYLIFSEGYAAATHASRIRRELCDEALRLAVVREELLPGQSEIAGLHALILFHDARRAGRVDDAGRHHSPRRSRPVALGPREDLAFWQAVAEIPGWTVTGVVIGLIYKPRKGAAIS